MPETKKRIIVDGVDFGELFQFHRIIRAVSASLQPPRLVLGLLAVLAIITFGKGWDKYDRYLGPEISPQGLLAGKITETEQRAAVNVLRAAIQTYVPPGEYPEPSDDVNNWTLDDCLPYIDKLPSYYRDKLATYEDTDRGRHLEQEYLNIRSGIERRRPLSPWEATSAQLTTSFHRIVRGALALDVPEVYAGLGDIFYRTPIRLWEVDKPFAIVFGIFLIIVMAIGGGALSRMAATQIAGQERLRVRTALAFSVSNWRRFSFALLLPVLLALIIAAIILVLGLLMKAPVLDVLGGALYGIALLLGFVFAFLLFGFAAGFSLLVPAVACENCDPGDAMQRSFAYVVNRPLHLLWYAVVALVGLVLGYLVVAFIASVMLNITAEAFGAFTDNPAIATAGGYGIFDLTREPHPAVFSNWHSAASGWLVHLWETIVVCLVAGYVFVYFHSATTVMYLLLRRAADGQDMEEIWRPGLVPGTLAPMPQSRSDPDA